MDPYVVDQCPDANGFSTIRLGDGSEHGDTDAQPIATVYDDDMADLIVRLLNEHCRKVGE